MMHLNESLLLNLHIEYDWMMNFEYMKNFVIFEKFRSLNEIGA